MPTIPELKAELKSLGASGYSGKNKTELMAMLVKAPVIKKRPAIIVPIKKRPAIIRPKTDLSELYGIVNEAEKMKEKGESKAKYLKKINDLWKEYLPTMRPGAVGFYQLIPWDLGWRPKRGSKEYYEYKEDRL